MKKFAPFTKDMALIKGMANNIKDVDFCCDLMNTAQSTQLVGTFVTDNPVCINFVARGKHAIQIENVAMSGIDYNVVDNMDAYVQLIDEKVINAIVQNATVVDPVEFEFRPSLFLQRVKKTFETMRRNVPVGIGHRNWVMASYKGMRSLNLPQQPFLNGSLIAKPVYSPELEMQVYQYDEKMRCMESTDIILGFGPCHPTQTIYTGTTLCFHGFEDNGIVNLSVLNDYKSIRDYYYRFKIF